MHRDSGKKCLVNSVVPKKFVACLVYSLPIQVASLAVVLSVYGIARTVSLGTGVTLLWWLAVALMIGTITSLITLTTVLGFRYLAELEEDETASDSPQDDANLSQS